MDWFSFGIVVGCLFISAFFSASETALTASSRASMLRLEKQGSRQAGVVAYLLNMRELAVPLEFPDWNAWLPPVHPLDVWTPDAGQTAGLFEAGYQGKNPAATFDKVAAWLSGHKNPNGVYGDWNHLTWDSPGGIRIFLSVTPNRPLENEALFKKEPIRSISVL